MSLYNPFSTTGTISITKGGHTLSGSETDWSFKFKTGDFIWIQGTPMVIDDVVSDTEITFTGPWLGEDLEGVGYLGYIQPINNDALESNSLLRQSIEQNLLLKLADPDELGTLANRDLYDGEARKFKYLRTDVDPHIIYFKNSDTDGDWSSGVEYQKAGLDGDGFTGGSYDPLTGKVAFQSNGGIGFETDDLRPADVVKIGTETKVIYVAADAGTRQSGDWPTVGSAGFLEALVEMQKWQMTGNFNARIIIRDGQYDFSGAIRLKHSQGFAMFIEAQNNPTTIDHELYTGDRANDEAVLRAAYGVVFTFNGGTGFLAENGMSQGMIAGILLINNDLTPTSDTAFASTTNSFLRLLGCSSLGFNNGINANLGSVIISDNGGHHIHCAGYGVLANTGSTVSMTARAGTDLYFSGGTTAIYSLSGSHISLHDSSGDIHIRDFSSTALYAVGNSYIYADGCEVVGGTNVVYSVHNSYVYHVFTKAIGNASFFSRAGNSSFIYMSTVTVDPNVGGVQQRAYAHDHSTIVEAGSHPEPPNYSPAQDTEGNNGSWVIS